MDQQSFEDLEIFKGGIDKSVFTMCDFAITEGGRFALQKRLRNPLKKIADIKNAQRIITNLVDQCEFWRANFNERQISIIERYVRSNIIPFTYGYRSLARWKAVIYKRKYKNEWYFIYLGASQFCFFIQRLKLLLDGNKKNESNDLLDLSKTIKSLFQQDKKSYINKHISEEKYSSDEIMYLDALFRGENRKECLKLLNIFYEIDALFSLAKSHKHYKLTMPNMHTDYNVLKVDGLYHPFLLNAKRNDFSLNLPYHILFLTGPNMSGKSTFLKALGISVYLAHLGMGVPANYAEIPVFDDIFININISDNISEGYSYFLSEINRIDEMAKCLTHIAGARA